MHGKNRSPQDSSRSHQVHATAIPGDDRLERLASHYYNKLNYIKFITEFVLTSIRISSVACLLMQVTSSIARNCPGIDLR